VKKEKEGWSELKIPKRTYADVASDKTPSVELLDRPAIPLVLPQRSLESPL
jgi:hypothetical protein